MLIAHRPQPSEKKAFTIIEVMLVLALTGLLLVGMIGGTFSAINSQRYTDSVRTFAEYLRQTYSEVISPESLGQGNSNSFAILGKIVTFGFPYGNEDDDRSAFSATIIGSADIPTTTTGTFIEELAATGATIYCGQPTGLGTTPQISTATRFLPLWDAKMFSVNSPNYNSGLHTTDQFRGTLLIARSPTSGTVHTIFTPEVYNLRDQCVDASNAGAATALKKDIQDYATYPSTNPVQFYVEDIGFCVKTDYSNTMREVRVAADGRNTSAVTIMNVDVQEANFAVGNRCQ